MICKSLLMNSGIETVLKSISAAKESFICAISFENSSIWGFFYVSTGGVPGLLLNVGVFYELFFYDDVSD